MFIAQTHQAKTGTIPIMDTDNKNDLDIRLHPDPPGNLRGPQAQVSLGFWGWILVRAMRRLKRMRFDEAKFTTDQLKAILVMVCEGRQGKLNTLWIEQSDVIKNIPVDLLQSAMKVGYFPKLILITNIAIIILYNWDWFCFSIR